MELRHIPMLPASRTHLQNPAALPRTQTTARHPFKRHHMRPVDRQAQHMTIKKRSARTLVPCSRHCLVCPVKANPVQLWMHTSEHRHHTIPTLHLPHQHPFHGLLGTAAPTLLPPLHLPPAPPCTNPLRPQWLQESGAVEPPLRVTMLIKRWQRISNATATWNPLLSLRLALWHRLLKPQVHKRPLPPALLLLLTMRTMRMTSAT
mmetsp:Transcript_109011/g.188734  ORF Transcript_109011/g.188734 Transcript_109011/m.188734 type:complete len:205 (-) Transcript_109011:3429-4043(-)